MASSQRDEKSSSRNRVSSPKATSPKADTDLESIQLLSLEEVNVSSANTSASSPRNDGNRKTKKNKKASVDQGDSDDDGKAAGCFKGRKGNKASRAPRLPKLPSQPGSQPGGQSCMLQGMMPAGADSKMVRSGHADYDTLYASNDVVTGPMTVNVCNAPNNSTVQCGCDNINCPFCNIMMSMEKTDPAVLQ